MDAKYSGKTIVLPKEVSEALDTVKATLSEALGFEPSGAETVAYLLNLYKKRTIDPQAVDEMRRALLAYVREEQTVNGYNRKEFAQAILRKAGQEI